MTAAPTAAARPAPAAVEQRDTLAPNVRLAREAHRLAHHAYTQHVVRRSCCTGGRLCEVGQGLLERADDAGKAWDHAERRAPVAREA